ncbi:hypothetical protein OJAV_G00173650 [Oryzias javanicus]|uniref:Chemokine interleukin-8-like domain-containing protein n=1 Tax=Oryzias javanicus TaxID=123683 RepID=A0A437CG82_ORYJA|nr:hypothetical protein OJAV_G00173650 [Oryzias javanicus]
MQLCVRKLACLAVFAGVLLMLSSATEMKVKSCCTKVSSANISAPIIGYRIQRKNLPCVRAVIFETTEGEICSHWKQNWVFEKIMELEKIRKEKKTDSKTKLSTPKPTHPAKPQKS